MAIFGTFNYNSDAPADCRRFYHSDRLENSIQKDKKLYVGHRKKMWKITEFNRYVYKKESFGARSLWLEDNIRVHIK